jgi:4-amino-4-deoxy-L-arabinose transferase-like glycosyltransferase
LRGILAISVYLPQKELGLASILEQSVPHNQRARRAFLLICGIVLLTFIALIGAFRQATPWLLDIGSEHDRRFVSGMLNPETAGETGITFRWSEPEAQIWMPHTAYRQMQLDLRIYHETELVGERTLTIQQQGQTIAAIPLQNGWKTYSILLEGTLNTNSLSMAALDLLIDPVSIPGDSTKRGVVLDWFALTPYSPMAFPWQALVYTLSLAVLAGWLWRLDWMIGKAPQSRGLRVGAMTGGLAVALVSLAWLAPRSLVWLIPPMPWIVGGLAFILLASLLIGYFAPQASQSRTLLGIALLIAGQIVLVSQISLPLALALVFAGVSCLPYRNIDWPDTQLSRWQIGGILLGLFALALGLRWYRLADLPYGLWRDEGRHAMEGLKILSDPNYRPAYIPYGVDLPGGSMYIFAAALKLVGIHAWSVRTVTGLAGALSVLPMYWLVRQLYGVRIGLLAAFILACSHWHIAISRFSFPTIFDPMLQLTAWAAIVYAYRKLLQEKVDQRAKAFGALALAGICLGFAIQTYHTGRIGMVSAGIVMLFMLWQARQYWRRWLAGAAVLLFSFLLAASPLILFAIQHPEAFNSRVGSVSLLSSEQADKRAPLAKLDEALGRHALMFNMSGDSNGRHVDPDAPMLDWMSGLGLLAGVAICLYLWRDSRTWLLIMLFGVGIAPSILSVESPHAMRAIDALTVVAIVGAVGLAWLWYLVGRGLPSSKLKMGVASAACAVLVLWNIGVYFVKMPSDPLVWRTSYPYHTQIGTYIRDLAEDQGVVALEHVYVPNSLLKNDVFEYLTFQLPVKGVSEQGIPADFDRQAQIILPSSNLGIKMQDLFAAQGLTLVADQAGPLLPDATQPVFIVYRIAP